MEDVEFDVHDGVSQEKQTPSAFKSIQSKQFSPVQIQAQFKTNIGPRSRNNPEEMPPPMARPQQNLFATLIGPASKSVMNPPRVKETNKTVLSESDLGMGNYDSDGDRAGTDATPNTSKVKVRPFLNYNE